MLVNLNIIPKLVTRERRRIRQCLRTNPFNLTSSQRKILLRPQITPYKPVRGEFSRNHLNKFTGVYFCRTSLFVEDQISRMTGRTAKEDFDCFGICDNASQAIVYYNSLGLKGNHVMVLQPIRHFRWRKEGPYIGQYDPSCEYFEDEEGIDFVYAFTTYRV